MKKILTLILIQQWFIATFKGIKKEEYREITPYWAKRLLCMENGDNLTKCYSEGTIVNICSALLNCKNWECNLIKDVLSLFHVRFKEFEATDFRNGYKSLKEVPRFIIENKGISIGKGNPEWGYVGRDNVFIIHHGDILWHSNSVYHIKSLFHNCNCCQGGGCPVCAGSGYIKN